MPFTAATTGFHMSFDFGPSCSEGSSNMKGDVSLPMWMGSGPASGSGPVPRSTPSTVLTVLLPPSTSSRSTPEEKARSPAPVSTTTRTESSRRSHRQIVRISRCMVALKALWTSGRLRVTQATPSAGSKRMVSSSATATR